MSTRSYSILASLVLLLLGLLLFLGPVPAIEEKPDQSELWDEDWQLIEYYPEASKNLKLRFVRQSKLWRDLYYVETPLQRAKANKLKKIPKPTYLRRRGNHFIKNIFSDWYNPKLLGYYKLELGTKRETDAQKPKKIESKEEKGKEKKSSIEKEVSPRKGKGTASEASPMNLERAGIGNTSSRLLFYRSKDTVAQKPFILSIGKHLPNQRILAHLNKEPTLLMALPKHLLNSFDKPALSYRSREILYFPPEAYVESIELQLDKKQALRIEQRKIKEGQTMQSYWSLEKLGVNEKKEEFNRALGSSLENALRQLKIGRFADEEEMQKFRPSQELWRDSKKNFLELKIEIAKGAGYRILIRKASRELKVDDTTFALLQNSEDSFVDFVDMKNLEEFTEQVEGIEKFLAAQKEQERLRQAAAQKAKELKSSKKPKEDRKPDGSKNP